MCHGFIILLVVIACSISNVYANYAVIPYQAEDQVAIMDVDTKEVLALLEVPKAPVGVSITEDNHYAYITHPEAGLISEIDLEKKVLNKSIKVGGQPFGVEIYRQSWKKSWRNILFVTDWSRDAVIVVDAERGLVIDLLATGTSPSGIQVDTMNEKIYVANREDDSITVLDLIRPRIHGSMKTGKGPYAIKLSPDNKILFVTSVQDKQLIAFETDKYTEIKRTSTGMYPYDIEMNKQMTELYISNQGDNTVSIISYPELELKETIKVGKSPEAIDFIDDHTLMVTNWFSEDISIVDISEAKELQRIPAGKGVRAFGSFISR